MVTEGTIDNAIFVATPIRTNYIGTEGCSVAGTLSELVVGSKLQRLKLGRHDCGVQYSYKEDNGVGRNDFIHQTR